jgi:hypothetical protein
MSGLLRNLIALVLGLFARRVPVSDTVATWFWVTPFDAGIRVLKSDKYLQYAETAQLDYLLKVGQFFPVLRSGAGFVNLAQQVRFLRPIKLFSRVGVETRLLYADDKCGGRTLAPATFLACSFAEVPPQVRSWESALQAA